MAATNRYMNHSVGWTPDIGSPAALTGIKSIQHNDGIETLMESADYDLYHTTGGITMISPTITLRTIDAFLIYATVAGATGSLACTIRDFTHGATTAGGAKLITMSNAFLASRSRDSEYRQLATQNVTFHCTSTDGATNPVAITTV